MSITAEDLAHLKAWVQGGEIGREDSRRVNTLLEEYKEVPARLSRVQTLVKNALTHLTDEWDIESTPLHAIGHAKTELEKALKELGTQESKLPDLPAGWDVEIGPKKETLFCREGESCISLDEMRAVLASQGWAVVPSEMQQCTSRRKA